MVVKTIQLVIDKLVVLQEGLSITSPIELDVTKAFDFVPDEIQAAADNAWFQNELTLQPLERHTNMMIQRWSIHSQFLFRDAERSQALAVCTAMLNQYIDALNADVGLSDTVHDHELRGGNPTLATIRVGTVPFQGFDVFVDVEMKEGVNFA